MPKERTTSASSRTNRAGDGPTGSGKSTTLAAIINQINNDFAYHILTIEDPVEYMHRHAKSTVNQREVGSDTKTFALALRAALRQAPKVILIGEMRDVETIEIAMEAAETGHLVLSTLHTIDAAKTVDRIVGVFPKDQEPQVRTRLSQSFRYVISQRLLPKQGGGRIAALEILKSTMRTRDYVMKGETDGRSLTDAMHDGSVDGMQTFDDEIEKLWNNGVISKERRWLRINPTNLALRLTGAPENAKTKARGGPMLSCWTTMIKIPYLSKATLARRDESSDEAARFLPVLQDPDHGRRPKLGGGRAPTQKPSSRAGTSR